MLAVSDSAEFCVTWQWWRDIQVCFRYLFWANSLVAGGLWLSWWISFLESRLLAVRITSACSMWTPRLLICSLSSVTWMFQECAHQPAVISGCVQREGECYRCSLAFYKIIFVVHWNKGSLEWCHYLEAVMLSVVIAGREQPWWVRLLWCHCPRLTGWIKEI